MTKSAERINMLIYGDARISRDVKMLVVDSEIDDLSLPFLSQLNGTSTMTFSSFSNLLRKSPKLSFSSIK